MRSKYWLAIGALIVAIALIAPNCKLIATPTQVTKTFTWTSTGDDGSVGTAAQYSLRYNTDSTALINNWNTCTVVPGLPSPKIAGQPETFTATITLETGTTYFFALRVADEVPNWSLTSNIVRLYVPDSTAPLAVSNLQII